MFSQRIIVVLLFIFSIVIFSCGQERQRAGRLSVEDQIKNLTEELGLSDEQAVKIKSILEEQRDEMRELFDSAAGDREGMRAQMAELREKADTKINKILDDEQKELYKKFQEERQSRRRNRQR